MTVKVVADSTSDIPSEVAQELGITVVPLYVRFGDKTYLDGVDLSAEEFYHKLVESPTLPTTSQPSPATFTEVYSNLAAETDEIISIHISTKLSGTYNAALLGRDALDKGCRIEVIDSLSASMGFGLIAIAAAKAAQAGANLDQVTDMVRQAIPRTHFFGLVDTLEYLHKGGRIGKAQAFLGTMLSFKPLLTVRDGEVHPLERVRSRPKAFGRLCELVEKYQSIEEMAILHATTPDEAEMLAERVGPVFPKERIYMARVGPVIGTYLGPGALVVALAEGK